MIQMLKETHCHTCQPPLIGDKVSNTLFPEAGVKMMCQVCNEEWWYSLEFESVYILNKSTNEYEYLS